MYIIIYTYFNADRFMFEGYLFCKLLNVFMQMALVELKFLDVP